MANVPGPQASIGNGQTLNVDAARHWNAMVAEIKQATGIAIVATEGTRSWERQNYLYVNRNRPGFNPAWSPDDPRANHVAGRCVDVGSNVGYVKTREAIVFRQYAASYGFHETVRGEPWHFEWRKEWVTVNITSKEINLMALSDTDIGKLLNYPAYTNGPSFSQVLKNLDERTAAVERTNYIIRDPGAKATVPAPKLKITKAQDDADTNTLVRGLAASVADLLARLGTPKETK